MLYIILNLRKRLVIMRTISRKVQTAFRLDANLLSRLKRKAKAKGQSLNAYVENILTKDAPAELVWPKVNIPKEIPEEIKALQIQEFKPFTKKELEEDPKLEYLVHKFKLPVEE